MNPSANPENFLLGLHQITPETIAQYDERIPRYTSYPTVPFWTTEFGPEQFQSHLIEKTEGAETPLSLYVHLPFCAKRCLFCACNVIITSKQTVADDYLDVLEKEIKLARKHYKGNGKVIQLHLGGGTPNFLHHQQMDRLISILESEFDFSPTAERSIEIDPRVASPEDVHHLFTAQKFNRISYGVQDLHDETQAAIGREQACEITFRNVKAARDAGFTSVNIDLIYGLPMQTEASWAKTLEGVLELRPDRIALYNFAYLPERLPHHQKLEEDQLPDRDLKVAMFMNAHDAFAANGWTFIGMDHYALASDGLAVALQNASLRRNFMGYTTLNGTDLLSFGVSSISDFQGAFAQNVKKLSTYKSMVEAGELPVERGLRLNQNDLIRRFCVESVMCNGYLEFNTPELKAIQQQAQANLQRLEQEGLLELTSTALRVTLKGRVFLRNIAVVFDSYLQSPKNGKPMFSRAV
ncbi:MAG: oxygen-independent coproporphyrinogen III oxidase [Sumerlaeia bacterium]